MDIVQPGNKLTLYGQKTPRVSIYKHESHKLHQAFNVADGVTIVQGMPVALDNTGKLIAYDGTTGQVYLGVAVTDSVTPAYAGQRGYPVEVTVAVEGYMVCYWAASAAITPGYVKPAGTLFNSRYPNCSNTTSGAESKFIALAPASAPANGEVELVPVLIR